MGYLQELFDYTSQIFPNSDFDSLLKQFLLEKQKDMDNKPSKTKSMNKSLKKKKQAAVEEVDELNFSKKKTHSKVQKIEIEPVKKQLIQPSQSTSYLSGWIDKFKGNQRVTDADLNKLLIDLEALFVKKNIAQSIASDLISHIRFNLKNKQVGRFQSVWQIIKDQTNDYLTRLLNPKQSTNLLQFMTKKPYIVTFVGVNGVGKTTNLSKICYWLLQNNKSILIAACDTFRSGAVEQLQVHVDRLSATFETPIELYQQGYKKDAAGVAKEAIQYARDQQFDVVLIDTAGRMQDDQPLMQSLAKLIQMNPIDKIIFVGEALVGNECIEQLTKFNTVIKQRANRQVDYILLTKFDTVDDLVGAAINMVYLTKQPILFVGIGQNYPDLCELDVSSVVHSILK